MLAFVVVSVSLTVKVTVTAVVGVPMTDRTAPRLEEFKLSAGRPVTVQL